MARACQSASVCIGGFPNSWGIEWVLETTSARPEKPFTMHVFRQPCSNDIISVVVQILVESLSIVTSVVLVQEALELEPELEPDTLPRMAPFSADVFH